MRASPNQAAKKVGQERREALCEFLRTYSEQESVAPTREEIGEHLGITSTAVRKHLSILIAEGVVEDLGSSRGLRARL